MNDLTVAQELKFRLLAEGLEITQLARDWLIEATGDERLSSFDYASTSGVILELDDSVWVNAPIVEHNSNFVRNPTARLDVDGSGLVVVDGPLVAAAKFCLQPAFHSGLGASELMDVVVTHGDRVRLSPLNSCSMTCTFCNIPYDWPISRYELVPIRRCIELLQMAIADPVQPAQHILVSGGTPKPKHVAHYRQLYAAILEAFPDTPVDIMMVPIKGVLDLPELKRLGVNQLSINLEVFDSAKQVAVARQKFHVGRDYYLDFIETATAELGPGTIRSMLMVGLESVESTLEGVTAIAQRGGIPVLSPFRPDPATPLAKLEPPDLQTQREVYLRAREIVAHHQVYLGPACQPCTHNTLSFGAEEYDGYTPKDHQRPAMAVAA